MSDAVQVYYHFALDGGSSEVKDRETVDGNQKVVKKFRRKKNIISNEWKSTNPLHTRQGLLITNDNVVGKFE